MKRILVGFIIISMMIFTKTYGVERYGELICNNPGYYCYRVKSGESWQSLFPIDESRDLVMRLNRTNLDLRSGWVIAIPNNLSNIDFFSISPFPLKINPLGQKEVIVNLNQLAWGAYDANGNLINWGPASGGQDWCSDTNKPCRSVTGNYTVISKGDFDCISSKFPEPYGGAAMPYCMHYSGAYSLHGSFELPGYNASHGCIRMLINDARWMNSNFVDNNTKVVVMPYN